MYIKERLDNSEMSDKTSNIIIVSFYSGDSIDVNEDNGPAWSDRDYTYEEV